jgi:hypothetical protein
MRLIGLTGEYGWGKDEAFAVLDRDTQARGQLAIRHAFADPLKISGLRAMGLGKGDYTHEDFIALANSIKDTGRVSVSWIDHKGAMRSSTITGREFWQLYGTEAHRADDLGRSFGPNFWVDNLLPLDSPPGEYDTAAVKVPAWYHSFKESWAGFADYAVVTDVRFPNEADRIHELGGEVWLVDASERVGTNSDKHVSELGLPRKMVDRVIDNNGDLSMLETRVLNALDALDERG